MTDYEKLEKRIAALEATLWAWFDWEDDGTGGPDTRDYDDEGADILEALMADTSLILGSS